MPKGKKCETRLELIASRASGRANFLEYLEGRGATLPPERGAFEDVCARMVTVEPRGLRRPKGRPLA